MVIDFGVKNRVVALCNRFWELAFKGTKRTLYSAHQNNKLRRQVKCHAQLTFYLSTANKGQKSFKLPITKSPKKLVEKWALMSTLSF